MGVSLPPIGASVDTYSREWWANLGAALTPVVLILYLAFTNGGFEPVSRSVVGIAVWWTVLLGAALNFLSLGGATRSTRAVFGLAVAFAAWTALSLLWTDSDERTATELARVSVYLGVFTIALVVQGEERWRLLLRGVTAGVLIVCAVAVLSRMRPEWFPERAAGAYLGGIDIERRLSYPLNYSSALGAFAAIGLPLALGASAAARTIGGQALAAAALPVVALTLWMTSSSLSLPAAAIALAAFLVLAPHRLPKLATILVAAIGAAILFAAVEARGAFDRGLVTAAAADQGLEMLWITLAVCFGVGLGQAALSRSIQSIERTRPLTVPRRQAGIASGVAAVAAIVALIAVGAPGEISDEWDQFKSRGSAVDPQSASRGEQLLDFSGSGRYEFWDAAVDANSSEPLLGIGPGAWDFWWLEHGSYTTYVRDAHSLYIETLAELGIVGFTLIVGLSAGILGVGTARALRGPPGRRLELAIAVAGCAGFIAAATVEWVWELAVLPVVFLILAAIAIAGGDDPAPRAEPGRLGWAWRIGLSTLAVAGLIAIIPPLWGEVALQRSYDLADAGDRSGALDAARSAISAQPYAASPRRQEAVLLAAEREFGEALDAARGAADREPADWRNWVTLYRIADQAGAKRLALEARRRARELDRRSAVFRP